MTILRFRTGVLVLLLAMVGAGPPGRAQVPAVDFEGTGLPILEWLEQGEVEQMSWDIDFDDPELGMDQRIEFTYTSRIRAGDLDAVDTPQELKLFNWISSQDDGWLAAAEPLPYTVETGLPEGARIEFYVQAFITPGEYTLWTVLYNETTGRRNVVQRRIDVDAIDDDPFPDSFRNVPAAEFGDVDEHTRELTRPPSGDLLLRFPSRRPLEMEIVAALSAPESGGDSSRQRHTENIQGALEALAQIDLANGRLSIHGLDIVRRALVFEQRDVDRLDIERLEEAMENANEGAISVEALLERAQNPVFLQRYLEDLLAPGSAPDTATGAAAPLKVLIVLGGFHRFEDAEVSEMRLEQGCGCRAYHIRIRRNPRDAFDDIEDIIDPLDPRTFNVLTPDDLREAMGDIARELAGL